MKGTFFFFSPCFLEYNQNWLLCNNDNVLVENSCIMGTLRQDLPHRLPNSVFCLQQWPVVNVVKEDTCIILVDKHMITSSHNTSLKICALLSLIP